MKKLIAIAALAFTATFTLAQNQSQPMMFTGELISTPASSVDCGTLATAAVYEFKISMLSDNSYTEENIAIVIKCPEMLGANFFKTGATYKMELFDGPGNTQYSIINSEVLDGYNLSHNYWAGDIKRIN